MERQNDTPAAKPTRRKVTPARAAATAQARVGRQMINCTVHKKLPTGDFAYWVRPPPTNCWYVTCVAANNMMVGGGGTLVCISKRSGRILRVVSMSSE